VYFGLILFNKKVAYYYKLLYTSENWDQMKMINRSKAVIIVTALFTCITGYASSSLAPDIPEGLPEYQRITEGMLKEIVTDSDGEYDYVLPVKSSPFTKENAYFFAARRETVLPKEEFLAGNRINYRDLPSYFAYCERFGLTPTAIVGEVRGGKIGYYELDEDEGALSVRLSTELIWYPNPYHYFFIDIHYMNKDTDEDANGINLDKALGLTPSPDQICDAKELSSLLPQLGERRFGLVVFEFLPIEVAYSREAVSGALSILAPGGKLLASSGIYAIIGEIASPVEEGMPCRILGAGWQKYLPRPDGGFEALQCKCQRPGQDIVYRSLPDGGVMWPKHTLDSVDVLVYEKLHAQ
jgi:hypothetical protein